MISTILTVSVHGLGIILGAVTLILVLVVFGMARWRGIRSVERNRGHGHTLRLALFNRTIHIDVFKDGRGDRRRCGRRANCNRYSAAVYIIFVMGVPSPLRINRNFGIRAPSPLRINTNCPAASVSKLNE